MSNYNFYNIIDDLLNNVVKSSQGNNICIKDLKINHLQLQQSFNGKDRNLYLYTANYSLRTDEDAIYGNIRYKSPLSDRKIYDHESILNGTLLIDFMDSRRESFVFDLHYLKYLPIKYYEYL